MPGCDATPVLEAAVHDLDADAAFLSALVVLDGQGARFAAETARFDPLLLNDTAEAFGIIAPIGQPLLGL